VGPPVTLVIPEDTEIVRLQLNLTVGSTYERFRVGLRGAPGDEFWSQRRLQPEKGKHGPALRLILPGLALTSGHYELTLQGQLSAARAEGVGYYYFEVVRF